MQRLYSVTYDDFISSSRWPFLHLHMIRMYIYTYLWDGRVKVLMIHEWPGTLALDDFLVAINQKVERLMLPYLFHTQQDKNNPTKASGKLD
jgi:hypothetical protein